MAFGWSDIKSALGFGDNSEADTQAQAAADKAAQQAAMRKELDDRYYKDKYGVNADYIRNLDTPKPLQQDPKAAQAASDAAFYQDRVKQMQHASDMSDMRDAQGEYENFQNTPPEESTWDKFRHGATDLRKKYLTGGVTKAMDFVQEHPNLVGAGLGALGGVGGYMAAKGDYQDALNTLKQSADLAGAYEALGPSKVAGIQDNQQLKDMQMQALKKTQEEALMGTTAEDEAYRRQQQKLLSQGFKSREAQSQDEMARRGAQAGSGLALMQGLANNQATLQQGSEAADADMIRKAQARRMAVGNLANQASGMQNAEFNREVTKGSAADQFNMSNVANKMSAARAKAQQMGSLANAQTAYGKTKAELGTSLGNVAMQGAVGFDKLKNNPQQQNPQQQVKPT